MGKIEPKVFQLTMPVGEIARDVTCELAGRVGNTFGTLKVTVGGDSLEYRLVDPVHDGDLAAGVIQFNLDLSIPQHHDRFAEHGLVGLKFGVGIQLSGVRIAVRCADRASSYTPEHPFFALYLDWTVTAAAADGTQWSNGDAQGEVQLRLPLTTGFACAKPPDLPDIGIADLEFRLDLDGIVVTTGWLPLTLPALNLSLPPIGNWFGWLAGIDLAVALPTGTSHCRSSRRSRWDWDSGRRA